MKFSYTALSAANQKTTGLLEAETKEQAQKELHDMGAAILSLIEISEEEFNKQKELIQKTEENVKIDNAIKTFRFLVIDHKKKSIKGTIEADDLYFAYKRLRLEYQFEVQSLFEVGASLSAQNESNQQLNEFEKRLISESKGKKSAHVKKNEDLKQVTQNEIPKKIDLLIEKIKKGVSEHEKLFSKSLLFEIHTKIDELERIKRSNNINHINHICQNLSQLIESPDQTAFNTLNEDQYITFLKSIKENNHFSNEDQNYKQGVQKQLFKDLFSEIGTQIKNLSHLNFTKSNTPKISIKKFLPSFFTKIKTKNNSKDITKTNSIPLPNKTSSTYKFLFLEIDLLISWLLAFYVFYFFLVGFSLEKEIGFNSQFIIKTIKSPLVLNITFLLLFIHLSLYLKNIYFRKKAFLNLGFFSLAIVSYFLLITNF